MQYPVLADVDLEEHSPSIAPGNCRHNVNWHEGPKAACEVELPPSLYDPSKDRKIEILEIWMTPECYAWYERQNDELQ
jgi:hypothetical protein